MRTCLGNHPLSAYCNVKTDIPHDTTKYVVVDRTLTTFTKCDTEEGKNSLVKIIELLGHTPYVIDLTGETK